MTESKIVISLGSGNEAKLRAVKMAVEKIFCDSILEFKCGNVKSLLFIL